MQANEPMATSRQKFKFTVFPEAKVVLQKVRLPSRRHISKVTFLLVTLAISGMTSGSAHGAGTGTLSFYPSSASLGSVTIGSNRTTTVTITNTGTGRVRISSESVHASGFSVSGLQIPVMIGPGESATMTITFSPINAGLYAGYIALTSDAVDSSVQYPVNGTGVTPGELAALPSSVSFPSVAIGSTNSQSVQLKNTGGSALTIYAEGIAGVGFSLSGLVNQLALGPGQTATFAVVYTPTTIGTATGAVVLWSTASNTTLTLPISGTGVSASRTIAISSANLSFGNELVGGSSTQAVTLTNTGNASVTVSQVSVSGTAFSVGGGLAGTTIAAGQTAELNVAFAPKTTGTVSGKVSITSNASNSPSTITLSGAGSNVVSHSVTLNWAASSSANVIGYYVYRSTTSGGSYSMLTSAAVNALNYTDRTVSAGTTYYYVVTAANSSGVESGHSAPVSATIP